MSESPVQPYASLAISGKQKTQLPAKDRLDGLDLARFLAFIGMVIVNFGLALGASGNTHGTAGWFVALFEGRAAATFVVLAGIGFSLMTRDGRKREAFPQLLKRSALLMAIGLLNMLIFPADILHFYAVYFLLGLLLVRLSSPMLWGVLCVTVITSTATHFVLDYETSWNWADLSYADFWTVAGFLRNLLFNGFHPVFPWLSFMILGLVLARFPLGSHRVQIGMIVSGVAAAIAASWLSSILTVNPFIQSNGLLDLVGVKPMPPGPLYVVAGLGTASAVIGACLLAVGQWPAWLNYLLSPFLATGRMTLTLYAAHILIGMLVLVLLGYENSGQAEVAIVATAIFVGLSVAFGSWWTGRYRAGPLELAMRRITG